MQTVSANLPLKKILISEEQIIRRVKELGAQISKDYEGKTPLFVCVLRGSAIFYAELVKNINTDCHLDFMCLCSYSGTCSSGKVRFMLDLREDIKNRHVIIVEDIIDTGTTAKYITDLLSTRGPASVELCTLLDKPSNREAAVKPRYCGFTIENEFVVGYGLDYNELYRNLPFIGVFDESKQ
ncbi:MAG: hypoxanthine phosphoribosyltransferase [Elusimicrobiota bacterium]|jgi:hypoxanthine phosphoribosyltransferase|nr:hypoxanthine phosphoribosyltransferase [Elusimicrobiota bacterium]MDR0734660.1 hypoxanthine phosphoribosyltransferase [Elusimicrobiota bacterium]